MGYMGFGMRKEVYTRRPKILFSRLKRLYGGHLEDYDRFKNRSVSHIGSDKADFKKQIRQRLRKEIISENLYNTIITITTICIVGFALFVTWQLIM